MSDNEMTGQPVHDAPVSAPPKIGYNVWRRSHEGGSVRLDAVECHGIDILGADGQSMTIALFEAIPGVQGFGKIHFRMISGVLEVERQDEVTSA